MLDRNFPSAILIHKLNKTNGRKTMIEYQAVIDAQGLVHDGKSIDEAVEYILTSCDYVLLDDDIPDFMDLVLDTGRLDLDDFNN